MSRSVTTQPRVHIERADDGYRIVGDGVLIWEHTLGEAVARRDEFEGGGWSYPPLAPVTTESEDPPQRIIYGPVESRRLGRSLGINLTPQGRRVCSFSCVYCEFVREDEGLRGVHWPTPGEIGSALANTLPHVGPLDSITISGHGEPTLHPQFGGVVANILSARRGRPEVPIRILTNGTQAIRASVRRALDLLDERIVALDAEPELVNRPSAGSPLEAQIEGVAKLRSVTIQSCFIGGAVSNVGDDAVARWLDLVSRVEPRAAQLYTISRQPGAQGILPVSRFQLEEIACAVRDRTGIEAGVYA